MQVRVIVVSLVLAFSGCESDRSSKVTEPSARPSEPGGPARAPAKPSARPAGDTYVFDSFKLGELYQPLMERDPYARPCDDDPVDNRARRAMVYGGTPCRGHAFPETTTVVFFLEWADGDDFNRPIQAFAWLGGGYYRSRSTFPVHPGDPATRTHELLGKPLTQFRLDGRIPLLVQRHGGDVYSLIDDDTVAGLVVGPMPQAADNEQWRVLMQMYRRYTPRVVSHKPGGLSEAKCKELVDKIYKLLKSDPEGAEDAEKFGAGAAGKIEECMSGDVSQALYDCAMRAKTYEDLGRCEP